MRITRNILILALMLVTAMFVAAQDLTETTTISGITVSHPEGFMIQELSPGSILVLDPTDNFGILIFTGQAVAEFGMPVGFTAQALIENIPTMAEIIGEARSISLPNGEGTTIQAGVPGVGTGHLFAVDTANGLVVAFAVAKSGTVPDEFAVLAQAVIGSVSFEGSTQPQVEPTAAPEVKPTPAKGSTTEGSTETGIDGETCPIPVSDMPERTLVFCLGALMTLPENWALIESTTEIDTFASVSRENFSVSLSTTVSEITQFYNPEMYATDVLPFIADSLGHTTYDPAEHVVTAIEEDGRTIQYYDPSESIEMTDENSVRQVVFIVTLNNDLFVTHTFTWVPSVAGEGFESEIEQIVISTQLADFYDGIPALVELDGEKVFVQQSTWSDSTYSFRFNEEEVLIVVCPPGGTGVESTVWGTEIYTNDSSICLAAVHAGAISLSDGGTVKVTMLPGQDSYTGSTANGITTSDYGTWSSSYSVEAFELP